MATASNQLQNLLTLGQVLGMTSPKGQKTTQTSQTNVSQQGIEYLMNQALSGPGGLAQIGAQARGSGLYNSTTEELLKNDATARAAGEAAARSAPTTTTQNTQGTGGTLNAQALILPALGLLNSSGLLGQGIDAVRNFINPVTAAPGVTLGGQGVAANTFANSASLASGTGTSLSTLLGGAGDTATSVLGGLAGSTAGNAASGAITAAPGLTLANAGTALGSTAGAAAGSAAASGAGNFALSSIPGIGGVLGGLLSGGVENTSLESFLGTVAAGAAAGGPVGMVAAPVFATFGAMLNDLGVKSIVCTALVNKGLLDARKYSISQRYLRTLHPFTIKGYYSWGRKLARAIDLGNSRAIKLALPWAKSRTDLICDSGFARYFKYPLGTITWLIGQPVCFVIGAVLTGLEKVKELNNGHQSA